MNKSRYSERPRLKLEWKPLDIATELLGIVGLILLIGLPLYFQDQLSQTIPRHFGANGEPDGFSRKSSIWVLPVIGLVLYVGMFWLNKFPHIFNYPQKVTDENAQNLYTVGTRMVRTINVLITWVFAYITYSTIQTALGNQSGIGMWFLPVFMLLTFGVTGYFLFKSTGTSTS